MYATSRGKNLLLEDIEIIVVPGAKLHQLLAKALEFDKPHVAYFVGGLPDMVQRYRDVRFPKYQEMVVLEGAEECCERVTKIYNDVATSCLNTGVTPVFATILPMQIEEWNCLRKRQGKTDRLFYSGTYGEQQERHEVACVEMIKRITNINSRNGVITPYLASAIVKCKKRRYTFQYHLLTDGVHMNEIGAEMCSKLLERSVAKNRVILVPQAAPPQQEPEHTRKVWMGKRKAEDDSDSGRDEVGHTRKVWIEGDNSDSEDEGKRSWQFERARTGLRKVVM